MYLPQRQQMLAHGLVQEIVRGMGITQRIVVWLPVSDAPTIIERLLVLLLLADFNSFNIHFILWTAQNRFILISFEIY